MNRKHKPRLHLDADTSIKSLYEALQLRGHDVTRTPNDWMPKDANDEMQLLVDQGNPLSKKGFSPIARTPN